MDLIGTSASVLDIGAGTGRMAKWLAQRGHDVLAVDPVPELRTSHDRWHTAALPDLADVDGRYDLLLLCAVWHHLRPEDRAAAWPRLAALCADNAVVLMSLRHGPTPADRPGFAVDPSTEAAHATAYGFTEITRNHHGSIQRGNISAGVTWTWLALRAG
ncbi:MAG: class I SAM-dependent methyltransferase [Pseudomonadota bacterium]